MRKRKEQSAETGVVDRTAKTLGRQFPETLLRLVRVQARDRAVTREDVSVNLPEHRADQVYLVGRAEEPDRWALYLEYQLQPDRRVVSGWFLKCAALHQQLGVPVILVVVYLRRGARKRFPIRYAMKADGLKNEFRFETVRLWEHADRIRHGELPELAPLLTLCDDEPTEATLREERDLILGLMVAEQTRNDLLALAAMVGKRYSDDDVLRRVFRKEQEMLKDAGFVQEWMQESREEGREETARRFTLQVLTHRFGAVPPALAARVGAAGVAWCEELVRRALGVETMDELELP